MIKLFKWLCVFFGFVFLLALLASIPIPHFSWEGFFAGIIAYHLAEKVMEE